MPTAGLLAVQRELVLGPAYAALAQFSDSEHAWASGFQARLNLLLQFEEHPLSIAGLLFEPLNHAGALLLQPDQGAADVFAFRGRKAQQQQRYVNEVAG